jgi:3-oxoacyl-[acyl-carrier protein] reductase
MVGGDTRKLENAAQVLRETEGVAHGDVVSHGGSIARPADIAAMVEAAVGAFGRLDIVVSHSGATPPGDFDSLDPAAVEASLRTTVLGTGELARQAAPHLPQQGSGRIIVVIDQAGKLPDAGTIASCVTGAAQHALVKALSDHLAKDNILVTAACAGAIRTSANGGASFEGERYIGRSLEHQESGWGLQPPLGQMGEPEDVANAIAFLASERSAFLTGTNLDVDGGCQRMIF